MHCDCTGGCHKCAHETVNRQVFNCPGSQQIIKHQHVVKHQHDVIHEYDVIHEHEYNTRDVVREREVVNHNDCRTHQPIYCNDDCNSTCNVRPTPRNWNFFGRR
ncbi:MAG: hypothetical protein FWC89_12680 [Defluviitaleaceae bacterium]|nr:hypothetical protein [Defluviitaleaceae bacterium]